MIKNKEQVYQLINNIVEYKDIYNEDTRKITILDVLNHGNALHISVIMKLLDNLRNLIYDVDISILYDVALLHDIGKNPPKLSIGDVVSPNVFEAGWKHAFRSSEMAEKFTDNNTILKIIKFHHCMEPKWINISDDEKVLLRLFKIIDGLSAAITRKDSNISFKYLGNGILIISEISNDIRYNGTYAINFFRSEEKFVLNK